MDKILFHIDVNSAFLSWTAAKRLEDDPSVDLRLIPSVIGGDRETRHGIVLAKSIPAKKYGIETAEPIASALRKCPSLLVETPDFHLYKKNSRALMEYLSTISPAIEQVSIDECYMDFTPIAHEFSSPTAAADIIRRTVFEMFGFTVNIGISDKKVLAKMASDFEKPDKTHTLFTREIKEKMWPLPVSDLFMCGKSSVQILYKLGILTIGDLATADPFIIHSHLKSHGNLLFQYANGIDDSDIITEPEDAKGVGNSTTLQEDVTTEKKARDVLLRLAETVSMRLRKSGKYCGMVSVEIKYSTFQSVSHQTTLPSPSASEKVLYDTACRLFSDLWNGQPLRLLGIRTSKLQDQSEPVQMSIFDYEEEHNAISKKQKLLEQTIDGIRQKYGDAAVIKGRYLNQDD